MMSVHKALEVVFGKPIYLTREQRGVVDLAIVAVRHQEGMELKEGRCIELICADYLAGVPLESEKEGTCKSN